MKQKKCVIIDYGIGNVFSVMRAIEHIGHIPELSSDPVRIISADTVILPGVGAFGEASQQLKKLSLDSVILEYIARGKPFLGICVGMQLLMDHGDEFGPNLGLGVIHGSVTKILPRKESGTYYPVPLIGWFPTQPSCKESWIKSPMKGFNSEKAFYFLHSHQAKVKNLKHVVGYHQFGKEKIISAVKKDNVFGVQFHPEKSAESGQIFLKQFVESKLF